MGRALIDAARVVIRGARDHDLEGEAAKIAFFFFLSLFPLILILAALTGIIGGEDAFARIASAARSVMPPSSWNFVNEVIGEITQRERPGALSLGIVLTGLAASSGVVALIEAVNKIWAVSKHEGWLQERARALAFVAIGLIAVASGAAALGAGSRLLGLAGVPEFIRMLRWPVATGLVTTMIWLVYHFLPARAAQSWRLTLAGAAGASAGWVVMTMLFGLYVRSIGQYGKTYGAIGAVIALVIWFYASAFVILLGAEVVAMIERGYSDPQQPSETPGRVV
jgi:membrane protein